VVEHGYIAYYAYKHHVNFYAKKGKKLYFSLSHESGDRLRENIILQVLLLFAQLKKLITMSDEYESVDEVDEVEESGSEEEEEVVIQPKKRKGKKWKVCSSHHGEVIMQMTVR
jgi:hypothetical protein